VCKCVSETETQTEIERVRHREPSKWKSAFGSRLRVKGEGFREFRVWVSVG
jgi:hypothetical protein